MKEFHQPSFYHFTEDSIKLAHFVSKQIDITDKVVLDLCAGSGVIGIELRLKNMVHPLELIFIEIEEEFKNYLEWNIKDQLLEKIKTKIIIKDFSHLVLDKKVDLIVSNPPYYFKENGKKPKDPRREVARSLTMENFKNLFQFFNDNLREGGVSYFIGPKKWEEYAREFKFKKEKEFNKINIYSFTRSF